jgi:hypothetical protein
MTHKLDRYTLEKAADDAEILDICADAYLQAKQDWKGGGPVPLSHTLRAVILALRDSLPEEKVQNDTPAMPEGFVRCPISLDANPTFCSAGSCTPCLAWREYMKAVQSETAASATVPEGWKLVPVEPTPEMIRVAIARGAAGEYNEGIWKAMLAAAPASGKEKL